MPPYHICNINFNIFSHLYLGLPSGLLPSIFPTESCMQLYSPTYVLHTPPTSVFMWFFYVVFSNLLLPRPSQVQIPPQYPILENPQPTFLPQCEWPLHRTHFYYYCVTWLGYTFVTLYQHCWHSLQCCGLKCVQHTAWSKSRSWKRSERNLSQKHD